MKKQHRKNIFFKKTIIAKIDTRKIQGGFVNPTNPDDDTENTDCFTGTISEDSNTNPIIIEPNAHH